MYGNYYGSAQPDYSVITTITILSVLSVVSVIVCLILCAKIADSKGRSVGGWIAGGIFLGWIAVIILAVLPSNAYDYKPGSSGSSSLVRKYQPYTCFNCHNTIDTRTCTVCHFSNPDNLLKPLQRSDLINVRARSPKPNKNATVWYCKCGSANDLGTTECASCYAKKEI